MKRYKVILESSAQADIASSYDWGVRRWGRTQANNWIRELRQACRHLATLPEREPLAPEDDEFTETIRHLIVGRYLVLFTIKGKTVHILHVRGAYTEDE